MAENAHKGEIVIFTSSLNVCIRMYPYGTSIMHTDEPSHE